MKRLISRLLILCILFTLCPSASADTKNVESLMLAVDATSDESISSAKEAYNSLTEKEKEQVSGKAKETLFQARLLNLANKIIQLNKACESVSKTVSTVWDRVGSKDIMNCLDCAHLFYDADTTIAEYAMVDTIINGQHCTEEDITILLWSAARGFNPSALEYYKGIPTHVWISEEKKQETIAICAAHNEQIKYIKDSRDSISEAVREFRSEYKIQYADEVSTLNNWLIESNLFADFALSPQGSLNSYNSEINEYISKINRFMRTMDTYY